MIRLIASDMDGTLLNNRSELSLNTVAAINAAQRAGIHFIINTGREYSSAYSELKAKRIYCDMICSSGAATYDQLGNSYNMHPIPKSTAKEILTIFRNFDVCADVYTNESRAFIGTKGKLFHFYDRHVFPVTKKENKTYYRGNEDFFQMVSETKLYESVDTLLADDISVLKISTTHLDADLVARLRKQISMIANLSLASTSDNTLEISDQRARKGYALLQYAEKLGIKPHEILTIGDSENDLSMLNIPMIQSVAMKNASEHVKASCKYITKSNEEDGVAFVIEDILREQSPRKHSWVPQTSFI